MDLNGNPVAAITTDATGAYHFTNLAPGTYDVHFTAPSGSGYVLTAQDVGGNTLASDAADSDANSAGITGCYTLASGETNNTVDAGLYKVGVDVQKYVSTVECNTTHTGCGTEGASTSYWKTHCTMDTTTSKTWSWKTGWTTQTTSTPHGWDGVTDCKATDTFNTVFGVKVTGGDQSLYNILCTTDGGTDAMMRESIAAYLNACNGKVDYAYDKTQVCDQVQHAVSCGDYTTTCNQFSQENAKGCDWTTDKGSYQCNVQTVLNDADTPPGLQVKVGSTVDFTYIVTNTGNTALKNVTLVDDRISQVTYVSGDTNHNGLLDVSETWTYKASEIAQAGLITNIGTVTAIDSVGNVAKVTASDPANYTGIGGTDKASLGDLVWNDANHNGIQDTGETGLAGVAVTLLGAGADGVFGTKDDITATTTTGTNGNYQFNNLDAGKYQVSVAVPSGFTVTAQNQGSNNAVDSNIDSSGKTQVINLATGEQNLTIDAGLYVQKAHIGDKVWEDMNCNGIQDAGEAGIANVQVKLLSSTGTVLQTTYTDANGNYGFDVAAGSYKVQVVTPSGYYETKANQGSNDSIDSDISSGVTGLYTVTTGQSNLTVDAGLYKKASLGDFVWDDMNHNSVQDANEPGVSGVKVCLYTSTGTLVASTTTDSTGHYLFSNLNPGDYYEVFDKTNVMHYNYGAWYNMNNWKWAPQNVGSNDSIDSDVAGNGVSTTNVTQTGTIHLVSGQNDMSWDAGITPIVIDLNGDGIQTVSRANSTGTFDLLGNGHAIQSGWLSGQDGFLAVDSNHNGKIDNINELFGGVNKGDGYAKLASFDSNGDGVVDARDANFADLLIWKDVNGNHQTDAGELMSLADAGVSSLSLANLALPLMDGNGNLHLERGSATLANGTTTDMTDVYFGISAADANAAGIQLPSLSSLLSNSSSLDGLLAGVAQGTAATVSATTASPAMVDTSSMDAMKQLAHLYDHQVAVCA